MPRSGWLHDRTLTAAAGGAAFVGAQFIAGKAVRDAVFLTNFEPSALPLTIIGTSILAILLVMISTKSLAKAPPAVHVPAAFLSSAAFLFVDWALIHTTPRVGAVLLYAHVSGVGPLLGSGFWLIVSERFDPRTAKRQYGWIGAAGTAGGLIGGLIAARLSTVAGPAAILPALASLHLLCAWRARTLARPPGTGAKRRAEATSSEGRSGWRVLAETSYLRELALLVLVGTIAVAFVDFVFKVQVKSSVQDGASLGRFFSLYYAAVSLFTFGVQTFGSRFVLERLGLSAAMGAPALLLGVGGTASLLTSGLGAVVAMRGGEAIFNGSLLRPAYELFFTPIPSDDRRAVKAIVDVGADRSGDIIGAGIVQFLLITMPGNHVTLLVSMAIGCSVATLVVASRVSRGYVKALEQGLRHRAIDLDPADIRDLQTRTVLRQTMRRPGADESTAHADPEVQDMLALRSRDPESVRRVLRREAGLSPALVSHVIPLLEWDPVANDAVRALRTVAEERIGELIDALMDPNRPFAVRRRLARVFSVCVSQRAVDGLLLGLEDQRFEVRYYCGRSLAAIADRNPRVQLSSARVLDVVKREVSVSRNVWEGRQLLDNVSGGDAEPLPHEEVLTVRANRALAHVFNVLALVLPSEPLRIAYHALQATDPNLRGAALEYLESVLPAEIRTGLWPFLEDDGTPRRSGRSQDEILQDLIRSHQSILLHLEALKTRRDH